ncbi:hypothetical protein ACEWY4_013757 [Coilia grayii]|uniref:Uncharacterized protein n=1 Tax=Coilia grayii TaxID=363190 RepID=A0ABD1JX81_9TELE
MTVEINDDCAGMVLACLYCRFYDMCLMLPRSCNRAAQNLFPTYQNFAKSAEPSHNNGKDSDGCACDFDCGLFELCQETGDCLELAMEISEVCYH